MIRRFSTSTTMSANKPLKDTNMFKPIKVGDNILSQRISFLPCTRYRNVTQVSSDLMLEYYDARSKAPGTLIATEGTVVSNKTGNAKAPGIWSDEQVKAWSKIVNKVHENKSFISSQLWHLGRESNPKYLKENGVKFGGPSPIYFSEDNKKLAERVGNPIVEFTEEDIKDIIYNQFDKAAKNALKAGFDYLEIHHGNGYTFEQFLYPASNLRTDKYGGSIENRTRPILELIDHLLTFVPASKLGIKIAPFLDNPGFKGLNEDVHPIVTNGYLLSELQKRADKGQQLAFVSVSDARSDVMEKHPELKSLDWVKSIWKGTIIRGGNYSFESGQMKTIENDVNEDDRTIIGFGRHFIANPDLVEKLKNGWELNKYQREWFYTGGNMGLNTYPKHGKTIDANVDAEKAKKPISLAA